jgi:hypothetical protein
MVAEAAGKHGLKLGPSQFDAAALGRTAQAELLRRKVSASDLAALRADADLRRAVEADLAQAALFSGKSGSTAMFTMDM